MRLLLFCSDYSSYLPRPPDDGNTTGLRWRGCHNSAASFVSCAAGFPPKSLAGREEVSLSPRALIAPDVPPSGSQRRRSLRNSLSITSWLLHLRGVLHSLMRGLCTCSAVYSVVKLHERDRPSHLFPRWESGFGLCFSHVFQKIFLIFGAA